MIKRKVMWGHVTLGAGRPAIAVPVMGRDEAELCGAARMAASAGADVIELRADSLSSMPDTAQARAMCEIIRREAPGVPLLFTLRTVRDGGPGSGDVLSYEALLADIAASRSAAHLPLVQAIDCELSVGEQAFSRLTKRIHEEGLSVVGSSHDFAGTPPASEIVARLRAMERLGADVAKIAVMPRSRADVLTLMDAAVQADDLLGVPLIAIAMGPLGVLTRIGGETIGSCLTFGAAAQASAPGQLSVKALREALQTVHDALAAP